MEGEAFKHLTGVRGLLIYLNHPMRCPDFSRADMFPLREVYERLFRQAWTEAFPEQKHPFDNEQNQ